MVTLFENNILKHKQQQNNNYNWQLFKIKLTFFKIKFIWKLETFITNYKYTINIYLTISN